VGREFIINKAEIPTLNVAKCATFRMGHPH
jgi:hypothetical protein